MIDKTKLQELLAADPTAKTEAIWKGLGFQSDVTFYYHLKKDPEAKALFNDAKARAKAARGGSQDVAQKASVRAPQRKSQKKAKRSTPPRNGHAKGGMTPELLRRIKHEFEHIALYESFTDHFDEIRQEVNAIELA